MFNDYSTKKYCLLQRKHDSIILRFKFPQNNGVNFNSVEVSAARCSRMT